AAGARERGKPAGERGGRAAAGAKEAPQDNCFFVGPPLPLSGRLYTLVEKGTDMRLVEIDAARGEVTWVQSLCGHKNGPITSDIGRRIRGAHLAYADGVLVCPTNAGAIVGVDLLSRRLLAPPAPRPPPPARAPPPPVPDGGFQQFDPRNVLNTWKASPPIIADGRVVFAPPDGDNVECLNLRDGKPLWKVPREDGLYLAGVT